MIEEARTQWFLSSSPPLGAKAAIVIVACDRLSSPLAGRLLANHSDGDHGKLAQ